jgi:hypothetical protein
MKLNRITRHRKTREPMRAEVRLDENELRAMVDWISTAKHAYDEDDPTGETVDPLEDGLLEILRTLENAKRDHTKASA